MPNLVGYIEIIYSNVIFVGNTLKHSGVIVHHVSNLFPNDSRKKCFTIVSNFLYVKIVQNLKNNIIIITGKYATQDVYLKVCNPLRKR